jgi:hypothetical protein
MASNRIKIQITGRPEDNGDVRVEDFIAELTNVKKALIEVDHAISEDGSDSVYFRVVDLSHSSPASIVLEAVSISQERDTAELVVNAFINGISQIQEYADAPSDFGYKVLDSFKKLPNGLGSKLGSVVFSSNGASIALTESFVQKLDVIIGSDESETGSITGMVEQINLHKKRKSFNVYPVVGKDSTSCVFPKHLRQRAIEAVGKYVTVYGRLKYKRVDKRPYEIIVKDIEIHPSEDTLPHLSELKGIAPDMLEGKSSEEFIWEIRDEWQ